MITKMIKNTGLAAGLLVLALPAYADSNYSYDEDCYGPNPFVADTTDCFLPAVEAGLEGETAGDVVGAELNAIHGFNEGMSGDYGDQEDGNQLNVPGNAAAVEDPIVAALRNVPMDGAPDAGAADAIVADAENGAGDTLNATVFTALADALPGSGIADRDGDGDNGLVSDGLFGTLAAADGGDIAAVPAAAGDDVSLMLGGGAPDLSALDQDEDGDFDGDDVAFVLGEDPPSADYNGDGQSDGSDVADILADNSFPTPTAIEDLLRGEGDEEPEPEPEPEPEYTTTIDTAISVIGTWAAYCDLTVPLLDYGTVDLGTATAPIEKDVTVSVECTPGTAYQMKPDASFKPGSSFGAFADTELRVTLKKAGGTSWGTTEIDDIDGTVDASGTAAHIITAMLSDSTGTAPPLATGTIAGNFVITVDY